MESKKTRVRQTFSMSKIENQRTRSVAFSNRRSSLYRMASELVDLFDVDIGMVLFSPANTPFSFFHPTTEAVIEHFLNPNSQLSENTRLDADQARNKVHQLNNHLNAMGKRLEHVEEIEYAQTLVQLSQIEENGERSKWKSIDQLNVDEITTFEAWLSTTVSKINYRLEKLENEALSLKNVPSTS
ncbi:agamous-like MADS-box protein AGL29 [Solanum stenotomum]|uniref:agamous-like MADS-box protein AGL29 n=1 Tax=Solanum stenotomum TaxID=172797 RepID=UPI0020D165CF|nr:agamous-like MADS-box protein AGL29 [Solanum stenotomum]